MDPKKSGSSEMKKGAEESVSKINSKNIVVTKLVLWTELSFDVFKKIILVTSKIMDTQSLLYYPEHTIQGGRNKSTIYFINSKLKDDTPHTIIGCDYLNCISEVLSQQSKVKFKIYEFQDKPKCIGFFHWKTYDFYQKSLVKSSRGKITPADVEKLTGEELEQLAKQKSVTITTDAYGTFYKIVVKDQKRTIQKLNGPIGIDKIDKLRDFLIPV